MISWPLWVRVWGWASYWFLPCTVFSLGLPFCFSSNIVHLWCMNEGVVSMFNESTHSFFVWGSLWALLPCHVVVTSKWVVSCTQITCIQPLSHCSLTLFASSFFSESVVVFSLFSPSFSPCVLSFLSLVYWPFCTLLLACLIRAAILYFFCHLHLFTSQCFVIGSPD